MMRTARLGQAACARARPAAISPGRASEAAPRPRRVMDMVFPSSRGFSGPAPGILTVAAAAVHSAASETGVKPCE